MSELHWFDPQITRKCIIDVNPFWLYYVIVLHYTF